jgi:dCMP deaminase
MPILNNKWAHHYLGLAYKTASLSKDPSTKVGAVIVGKRKEVRSTGYNGFPRGIEDRAIRFASREEKLLYTIHAEANSLYNALLTGVSVEGSIIVTTHFPCTECAKAIIQCGITEVISDMPSSDYLDRWEQSIRHANSLFMEAGVSCAFFSYFRGLESGSFVDVSTVLTDRQSSRGWREHG